MIRPKHDCWPCGERLSEVSTVIAGARWADGRQVCPVLLPIVWPLMIIGNIMMIRRPAVLGNMGDNILQRTQSLT